MAPDDFTVLEFHFHQAPCADESAEQSTPGTESPESPAGNGWSLKRKFLLAAGFSLLVSLVVTIVARKLSERFEARSDTSETHAE